jgi:hypothetical protein
MKRSSMRFTAPHLGHWFRLSLSMIASDLSIAIPGRYSSPHLVHQLRPPSFLFPPFSDGRAVPRRVPVAKDITRPVTTPTRNGGQMGTNHRFRSLPACPSHKASQGQLKPHGISSRQVRDKPRGTFLTEPVLLGAHRSLLDLTARCLAEAGESGVDHRRPRAVPRTSAGDRCGEKVSILRTLRS